MPDILSGICYFNGFLYEIIDCSIIAIVSKSYNIKNKSCGGKLCKNLLIKTINI